MNATQRRSIQRKGWLGLAVFAAIPLIGVGLLTASFSLFMVVLLAALLLGAFSLGGFLLRRQIQSIRRDGGLALGKPEGPGTIPQTLQR